MLADSILAKGKGPSFLRWAGSKRLMLPTLLKLARAHEAIYVEPFCGSAALYFGLKPETGYLYDLNAHLVHALKHVQISPDSVYRGFASISPDRQTYLRIRSSYNKREFTGAERASAFIYLNRHCFNGLWRTNKSGMFNVPFGGASSAPPSLDFFRQCSKILQGATIQCLDFRQSLVKHSGKGKLFFVDPPYQQEGTRMFQEYGPGVFTRQCLSDLEGHLRRLDNEGGKVILLYCDDPDIRVAFNDWNISYVKITRNVGGFRDRRKITKEILVTNFG